MGDDLVGIYQDFKVQVPVERHRPQGMHLDESASQRELLDGEGPVVNVPFEIPGDHVEFAVDAEAPEAQFHIADEGYFSALRVPMVAGRSFAAGDNAQGIPVVVINEAMALVDYPLKSRAVIIGVLDPCRSGRS